MPLLSGSGNYRARSIEVKSTKSIEIIGSLVYTLSV
jgi:hypothetical protein